MNDTPQNKKLWKAHDRYFRGAMDDIDVAMSCMRAHLPKEIVKQIDPASLQLMKGSFISEDLREKITDVTYRATLQGQRAYIYFLIEHQSTPDPLMALRLHQYTLQIIERDLEEQRSSQKQKGNPLKLPLVVPHVIYSGQGEYSYPTDIFELFHDPQKARDVFLQPFGLTILKNISDTQLTTEPLIGTVELLLKHASTRDMLSFLNEFVEGIIQTFEELNKEKLLNSSVSYLFETQDGNLTRKEISEEFKKSILSISNKTKIMTIADSLRREGRQEGLQEGRQQFRSLLLKQLKSRFPHQVTPHYLRLISEAESDKLAYWGERLMTAPNIEEVFSCF